MLVLVEAIVLPETVPIALVARARILFPLKQKDILALLEYWAFTTEDYDYLECGVKSSKEYCDYRANAKCAEKTILDQRLEFLVNLG